MKENSHHKLNHILLLEYWDRVTHLNNWGTKTEREANWLPYRGLEKSIAGQDVEMRKMDKVRKKETKSNNCE
jgi:hypothetical protein